MAINIAKLLPKMWPTYMAENFLLYLTQVPRPNIEGEGRNFYNISLINQQVRSQIELRSDDLCSIKEELQEV